MIRLPSRRVLAAAALAAGLALLLWGRGRTASGAWVEVRRADLVLGVEVSGTLEAVQSDLLGPPAIARTLNYQISFLAPEGGETEAGQPVIRFDTSELERTLVEMQAEREQAQEEIEKLAADLEIRRREHELGLAEAGAALRLAALKLDRPEAAVAANELAVDRLDLELRQLEEAFRARQLALLAREERTALAALREKRDRAAARVGEIEEQIRLMTVTAPHAGTVIHLAGDEGQKPKVGESVWRGAKVLEIPDLSLLRAAAEVAEIAAGRIAVGQPATLRLDAHPDVAFGGRIEAIERSVRRRSESDPTKVFRLTIALDDTDPQRMRPGMRFRGNVEVERVTDVLSVPLAAVFASPEGPRVYRRSWRGTRALEVELGRRSRDAVEVTAGLTAGERVALHRPEEEG